MGGVPDPEMSVVDRLGSRGRGSARSARSAGSGPRVAAWTRAIGLAAGLATAAVGCGHSASPSSVVTLPPSSTAPATTTPATTARTTPRTVRSAPTTALVVAAPQPSPDLAAAQLVGAWAAGNRARAASVAAPQAVATLFAVPYPGSSMTISRGCSSEFAPIVCTYGPPGGASPADPVFEIYASQTAGGWYVSAVKTLS